MKKKKTPPPKPPKTLSKSMKAIAISSLTKDLLGLHPQPFPLSYAPMFLPKLNRTSNRTAVIYYTPNPRRNEKNNSNNLFKKNLWWNRSNK